MNPDDNNLNATSLVSVSNAEIRAAKIDWITARDGDTPEDQVYMLFEYFRLLVSMQAQEIAEEFRAQHQR